MAGGAGLEPDPRRVAAILYARRRDAGRWLPDRQCAAGADAPAQERAESRGAFWKPRDRDVRCRLRVFARAIGTRRCDAAAIPQEDAAGSAERGQRIVAQPRRTPTL